MLSSKQTFCNAINKWDMYILVQPLPVWITFTPAQLDSLWPAQWISWELSCQQTSHPGMNPCRHYTSTCTCVWLTSTTRLNITSSMNSINYHVNKHQLWDKQSHPVWICTHQEVWQTLSITSSKHLELSTYTTHKQSHPVSCTPTYLHPPTPLLLGRHYGSSQFITNQEHRKDVVCFRNCTGYIIRDYHKRIETDDKDEKKITTVEGIQVANEMSFLWVRETLHCLS